MKCYTVLWLNMHILDFLYTLSSTRITGSFARGCATDKSDLDIRLAELDFFRLKNWLIHHGLKFGSAGPGHITYEGIEISVIFKKQKGIPSQVKINDLIFKTW